MIYANFETKAYTTFYEARVRVGFACDIAVSRNRAIAWTPSGHVTLPTMVEAIQHMRNP